MSDWRIFHGTPDKPRKTPPTLPAPPPWRDFQTKQVRQATTYQTSDEQIDAVNAAIYLRRPLFVTGNPGTGKSSLAHAVAHELHLGDVLCWPINSRTTLRDGLYQYDAIGRLQAANLDKLEQAKNPEGGTPSETKRAKTRGPAADDTIGDFIRLGPLGTAFVAKETPRVLLIDEIDKSDLDLPNDLLTLLEDGCFEIPELKRIARTTPNVDVSPSDAKGPADRVTIPGGRVQCQAFPVMVLTSNGERDMPPAFLRRCVQIRLPDPTREELANIVRAHLKIDINADGNEPLAKLCADFVNRRDQQKATLATDQLLNAVFLLNGKKMSDVERKRVLRLVLEELGRA
jgi:MoxR-like ATPase